MVKRKIFERKGFWNAIVAFAVALAFLAPTSAVFANIGRPIENEINGIENDDGMDVYSAKSMSIFSETKSSNEETSETVDWWPMFRHDPLHSGYSTSAAPDTNNLRWESKIGYGQYSSPAVVDGKIFIGAGIYKSYLYCISTGGVILWKYTTHGLDISSSPAVSDGKVFVGSGDNNVYCLDADPSDGIDEGIVDPPGSEYDLIWKYTTNNYIYMSSPTVSDNKVFIASMDNNLYCLDASDGTKLWNYTTGGGKGVGSSPAVADGKVFFSSRDKNLYCLDVSDGTKLWNYTADDRMDSSPAVSDGKVFFGSWDKNIYCLDTDGNEQWIYHTGGNVVSSPAVSDNKVFIGSYDGNLYCLNTDGIKLWKYNTGKVVSSPAVADGKVFVGSEDKNIYCLDTDGKELWKYTLNTGTYSSPAVADGMVFFCSNDAKIHCFGPPPDHDVGVKSIDSPVSGPGSVFTPEVTVKNSGINDETNVPVNMQITKIGTPDPEYDKTVSVNIDSGETKTVAFPEWTPDDLPTFGYIDYEVTACTHLEGDEIPGNDGKTVTISLLYLRDVGVEKITQPVDNNGITLPQGKYPVECIVKNYGIYTETDFNVNATIWLTEDNTIFYTDNLTIADINTGDIVIAAFDNVTFSDTDEGDYKIEITTELIGDDVPENDQKALLFKVRTPDTWPPLTTHKFEGVAGDNNWYKSDMVVTLTAEDYPPPSEPSGVNYTKYKIDDGAWEIYKSPFIEKRDGMHTLYYYSADFAGNVEDTNDADFKIDQAPPTINLTVNKTGLTKWLLTATVSDETSGIAKVEFYLDNKYLGEATESPYELKCFKKGTAQAIVYDNAGNQAISDPEPVSKSTGQRYSQPWRPVKTLLIHLLERLIERFPMLEQLILVIY